MATANNLDGVSQWTSIANSVDQRSPENSRPSTVQTQPDDFISSNKYDSSTRSLSKGSYSSFKSKTFVIIRPAPPKKPKVYGSRIRTSLSMLRSRFHSTAFLEDSTNCENGSSSQTATRRYTIDLAPTECDEEEQGFIADLEQNNTKVGIGGDNSILQELTEDQWAGVERERAWSVVNLKEQFISFFQPSNNRLALKLFGNKVALACERRRQREQGKWVIHPCSNFRLYWNLIMLVLLIANLIMLPVIISFFNDDVSGKWIAFNGISDTVFFLDIIVNFRTGIIRNDFVDDIILNPSEIAREYLRTWFALDLLSTLPIDYLFFAFRSYDVGDRSEHLMQAGRALRILRLAKLLSLLRLLRLSRLVRYITQWEEVVNIANKFMGICNLVLIMLLLGHWNACLQFLVPMLMDFPVQSWVSKAHLQNAHWFEQYTWALFKALSHMLSIGYGRYPPSSLPEAWITIVSMMTGATCYALFVGHAAALIQSFDASKRKYREMLKQVEEYMAFKKYPRSLRQRITGYYEHRYKGKMFNEKEILSELSECLREQIINYNCRALVAAVPIFANADQNFVSEVVVRLRQEVFQPGDMIIKEGTFGSKMYFIQEGVVNIITKSGVIATRLSDGCYFGEICLLTNARRVATVQAETYCTLYSLDQKNFYEVLDNYPAMRVSMEKVAAERLLNIGHRPSIVQQHKDPHDKTSNADKMTEQRQSTRREYHPYSDSPRVCGASRGQSTLGRRDHGHKPSSKQWRDAKQSPNHSNAELDDTSSVSTLCDQIDGTGHILSKQNRLARSVTQL
ncbi:Hyperpolarization activated cyclic nucleotide-gated potassium channel [Fasciola hepatica]|uniref:Hyperpolarization activated cyclic nucleotide-gated potassium channel n=1 Tax=Fasciola hepatica TaxID=6192 RepID=A0A4E0R7H0_FASHE|nr:Hyperpolarization activated cyclic nucleotide-gated potassium channel [Fasciola hepatica]